MFCYLRKSKKKKNQLKLEESHPKSKDQILQNFIHTLYLQRLENFPVHFGISQILVFIEMYRNIGFG